MNPKNVRAGRKRMNTRQQDIVTLVSARGEITIKELAGILNVSEMTIHRDLDYLQQERYLYKKRGAAVFVENTDRGTGSFYTEEKAAVGRAVAAMIKPGQSILFDNSTTAMECARFLDRSINLTFYTTNLETAAILSEFPNSVLYCSGGYYFSDSKGFVGRQAEEFVESLHADVCIIGASGISLERGITTPYPMHTALQRKIIEASKVRLLAVDHSKFDKIAAEKVAELSEMDKIITDSGLRKDIADKFSKHANLVII